ncbi:MAG: isochorismatase family protein [Candidatus Bathyarchaeia archaeon]
MEFTKRDEKILYIAEALEKYRKAGIGIGKVGFGKRPAILNVDIQYAFTSADCPLGGGVDSMVENTKKLIDEARKKKIPILYTLVAYRDDGVDTGVFGEKVPTLGQWCRSGTKWVQIDERVKPEKEDFVITKKMPSAFFGTDLFHLLTYLRVDTVIVTGDSTSGCVRASVIDSMSHGFRTIIPEECVGDRAAGPHKANLFDMGTKYADVIRLQDVLDYLRGMPALEVAAIAQTR